MKKITLEEIEAGRSKKGGFTRATLAKWGVPWPPPKGWMEALTEGAPLAPQTFATPALKARYSDSIEAELLRKVVLAVIERGCGHWLHDVPGLEEYYGTVVPTVAEVIGSRPKSALITGDITFEDYVYSFTCLRRIPAKAA